MGEKVGRTSTLAAFILQIVNFAVMFVCILVFASSLWMIASPGTMSNVIQHFGTPVMKALLSPETLSVQLGVALSVVTIFIFFVAIMGFYGSIVRSLFLLFMYSTMVILLLLLECALLFYFSSSLIEKGLQEQDGQWTHALRLAFQCCDHNFTSIFHQDAARPPWSCCGTEGYPNNCTALLIYDKDCHKTIKAWLHRYQTAIYASLSALHLLLASCSIVRRSRSVSHSHS